MSDQPANVAAPERAQPPPSGPGRLQLSGAVVRFAGDSGDGMQLTGSRFTAAAALAGNDLATFPDFPAEIRAPAGTLYGVSGFQVHFATEDVFTPGDAPDVLVAMNPAALKSNLADLKLGGLLVINAGAFSALGLRKAGYERNPLDDGSLDGFNVLAIDISRNTQNAVKDLGLSTKEAARCKNFWTLGLMFWLYGRSVDATLQWLDDKFRGKPDLIRANAASLHAGYSYGETIEASHERYQVGPAPAAPGVYRNIGGNGALALGLMAGAKLAGLDLVLGSYPITPASDILHELSRYKHCGVTTVQAEDEIAAVCAAIGASYAGSLGVTTTSGPGLALKGEAIGLAISTELPLVVVDIQRGGPSTGLPTKTEQADLLQAMFGRNGEAPLCVLAASSPSDCFEIAIEAVRIATQFMTPVVVLSDGYLANGAEPWRVPRLDELPSMHVEKRTEPEGFLPYARHPDTLARPWAVPGTPGLEHRIGGLEKAQETGHISYDPANHSQMSQLRAEKIERIRSVIPPLATSFGPTSGKLLVLGWGSTYGAIREAVARCQRDGLAVAHAHLRHINPFPGNIEELTAGFDELLVPELNLGQLALLLRARLLREVRSFTKIEGKPLRIDEVEARIRSLLGGGN